MATYYPPWLPVVSGMPDLEAVYRKSIPLQWPRGIRFKDTDIDYHRQAMGVVYSWLAEAVWIVQRKFFPGDDDQAIFLPLWEEALRLSPQGTIADRQARVLAKLRNRGTGNESVIFSIIAPAYGTPDDISHLRFSTPDLSTILADNPPADDPGWLDAFTGHFYSVDATVTVDQDLAQSILARITPGGWRWTAGKTQYLEATLIPINEGVVS
jgi:hypothetical protein